MNGMEDKEIMHAVVNRRLGKKLMRKKKADARECKFKEGSKRTRENEEERERE
jgi:hypothetical protein